MSLYQRCCLELWQRHIIVLKMTRKVKIDLPEKDGLTQHPCVGGHHEVGGDNVEDPAPHRVPRPDGGGEEDQVVPEDPAQVVEAQGAKEVDVDGDTGTSGGETTEHGNVGGSFLTTI